MRRIDVQKLTSLPRVWSYLLGSADPVLFGDHILVLGPSGRVLSFLSAQQGRARFALAAPLGVTWREVEHRAPDLVLLSGTDEKGQPTLSRISVDGKLLWHSVVNRYEHLMTADLGSGLWLTDRDGCQQSLLDGDTGKPPAPELVWRGNYDYGAFADQLQPSPPRFCVLTGHLRLWHRGMALLWSSSTKPRGGVLVAEAPGETPQRRWSIDGAEFRILRIDGKDITFFRAFPHSGLRRVRLSSGAII